MVNFLKLTKELYSVKKFSQKFLITFINYLENGIFNKPTGKSRFLEIFSLQGLYARFFLRMMLFP